MRKKLNVQKQSRPQRRQISLWESVKAFYANWRSLVFASLLVIPCIAWVMGWHLLALESLGKKGEYLLAASGFVVKEVLVEGRVQSDPKVVLAAVGVKRGNSIFSCDPELAKQELEKITWIRSAMVQRIMPDTVYIRLVERSPIAIWQNESKKYLVDAQGVIMGDFNPQLSQNLILVTGKDAPAHTKDLLESFKEFSQLRQQIKSAVFISGRRWDLIMKNNVRVKLPEKDIKASLQHLERLEKEHRLTDGRVATIDLRLPDRSFLRVQDVQEDKKNKGKIT